MRVLLIYPLLAPDRSVIDENKQYWPPLGLAYLGAYLEKHGHQVKILDRDVILRKSGLDFAKTDDLTLKHIEDFKPDWVGISVTTPNILDANEISLKIKNNFPNATLVLGGPHCVGEPELTLQICSAIDVLVRSEGEETLLELVSGKPVEEVFGITYKTQTGEIRSNPDRPLIENLDDLPLPARHLLDMEFYLRPSRFTSRNLSLRTTSIFTARGCPFRCHYCAGPLLGRNRVRYHSPQRIIEEVTELIEKYSAEALYFAEDMFLANKKRAKVIFDLMKETGISKQIVWMAQLSSNVVDEDFLKRMKEAGCLHVEYGFESGSPRVLKLMNKKSSVPLNLKAARMTKKVGIRFQGNFIVGYPGETEEDFKMTLNFIKKTKPTNIALNIFMPLPGTFIYRKLKAEGKEIPPWHMMGDPDAPQINYADMPPERFQQLYYRARLFIIIPLNLWHFLKDNIRYPMRLLYILLTQSKGFLVKTFRAIKRLRNIKN